MRKQSLVENAAPFIALGAALRNPIIIDQQLNPVIEQQYQHNAWFLPCFCHHAIQVLANLLTEETLLPFVKHYAEDNTLTWNQQKQVALIAPGNYPLAGFLDMLYILLSGNAVQIKKNAHDQLFLPAFVEYLFTLAPSLRERIQFVDRIAHYDAVIASCQPAEKTNFERYFQHVPHLLQTPQYTAALLTGKETPDQLQALSKDIYLYFGQAPRSIAKLYVPQDYDFVPLLRTLQTESQAVAQHHQFLNNLDYQKGIRLICSKFYMDAGTFLFIENAQPEHEIGVVHYQYYTEKPTLLPENELLASAEEGIRFGTAHYPSLFDYPNQQDRMQFLGKL